MGKRTRTQPLRDELPQIKVSRLRASGVITPDMEAIELLFGEVKRRVMLHHLKFPNGGGWSMFICPTCSNLAQNVRLYDGKVCCNRCDGLYWAANLHRAEHGHEVVERLKAKLYGSSKVKRRASLERSLRKAEITQRLRALKSAARNQEA